MPNRPVRQEQGTLMIDYKRIFVWPECNNRCLYCHTRNGPADIRLSDIVAQMNRDGNGENLELFGGEPTLRPDFLDILRAARGAGFKRIKIVTNARALADIHVAAKMIESGCYFFEIKVHHHDPAVHDAVTQVRGSLEETVGGIENLRHIDTMNDEPFQAFIHLRIPVSKHNYQEIGAVALAFIPYQIDRITLSFDDSETSISEILPYVRSAINGSILNRVWITTQRIPLCAMTGFEHHVSEIYRRPHGDFKKSKRCNECLYDGLCPGISAPHYGRYGFRDLDPVTESRHVEDIRRLHNDKA